YPLSVIVLPGRELGWKMLYDEERFGGEQIQGMGRHLRRVLEQIAQEPEQRVGRVSLLEEWERKRVVEEWSWGRREKQERGSIQEWIERQARRVPHAVAVMCGEGQMSYGELDRRANQVGQYLR